MKKSTCAVALLVLAFSVLFVGCGSNQQPIVVSGGQAAQAQPVSYPAPPPTNVNLDLQAVGELFRKAPNAQEFERLLNDPSTGINNLDQDGDGKVDYLQVQEWANQYGRGVKIFDIAVNPPLPVADIKIPNAVNNYVTPVVTGGTALYGPNYVYTMPQYHLSEAIFLAWLLQPHPVYVSPYHYGYYGSYYRPYRAVAPTVYRERVVTRTRTVTQAPQTTTTNRYQSSQPQQTRTYVPPPQQSRTFNQSNSQPTTQKQFQVRDTSKPIASGGFGRSSVGSSGSSSSSSRSSFGSSSSRPSPPSAPRNFGGGGSRGGRR